MLIKTLDAKIKAAGEDGADAGIFEAIVAAYNVDSIGDQIVSGAFRDTLAEWKASGDPIPVYWSHRMDDPNFNIGHVVEAKETDDGLWVKGQLDVDAPTAAQVYRLMKGRRVTQFSFAYDVIDGGPVKTDGESVFELRKLKLYELGPTPIGMNQQTELLDVKAISNLAGHVKAGRVLSAKNEGLLRDAHAAIGDVLAALDQIDDGKAKPAPAKTEEPSGAKVEEPKRSPATFRLLAELDALAV